MAALVAPPPSQLAAVSSWLGSCARDVVLLPGGDFLRATATVACMEALVGHTYYDHSHARFGATVARLPRGVRPLLPEALKPLVSVVEPTTHFPAPLPPAPAPAAAARGLLGTNPTTIRAAYGLGDVQASNAFAAPNEQQAAGFLKQYADPSGDLQSFFASYYKAGQGRKFKVVGPNEAHNAGDEASLDTQYIMAIGSNVSTTFWSTAGERPFQNEPYLAWLQNLTQLASVPNTVSVSYGDDEFQIEADYAAAVDVLFMKMGARGASMIFASGDGGVAGGQAGPCLPGNKFVPTWPAGDPYVTSVGATDATFKKASSFSSGGFSNAYAAPAYAQAAIAAYKAAAGAGLPPADRFNASGRGFPDVATVGEGFWIFCNGVDEPVDGTSCAAPTFSGVVSLLNDARMAKGKKPLGFLNQVIYAHPEVFSDVTEGSNPGCGTNGFPAAKGWDPITGWGAPNWPAMLALALQLP